MRIPHPHPRIVARSGFTLLELVIVLVVVAVVSCLAIPAWFSRSEVTLDNAARLLARDLREAQSMAAFRNVPVRFEFLENQGGYRVVDAAGNKLPSPSGPGSFERVYARDAIFEGVTVGRAEFAGERSVTYDENGFALVGGTILLRFGSDARVLRLAPETGQVAIEGLIEAYLEDQRSAE